MKLRTVLVVSDDAYETELLRQALQCDGLWRVNDLVPGQGALPGPHDVVIVDLESAGALEAAVALCQQRPESVLVLRSGRRAKELNLAGAIAGARGILHEGLYAPSLSGELAKLAALVAIAAAAIVRKQLPADPKSAGAARRMSAAAMAEWGLDNLSDDVALLISELVGNAVRHAGTDVAVTVALGPRGVRVEVGDDLPQMPGEGGSAAEMAEGGRGLEIVAKLATRWGVTTRVPGKTIWFEIEKPEEAL